MKVVILPTADRRLRAIVHYAKMNLGMEAAERLATRITGRMLELEQFPRGGSVEELMDHLPFEYRRLIEGYYKIIYRIKDDTVYITTQKT